MEVNTHLSASTNLLPSLRARSAWRGRDERSSLLGVGGGGCQMPQRTQRPTDHRVPRARVLRSEATEAEKKLWQHLRQPPFKQHHFRRQATIGPCFADFASHQLKLVIEVDGGQHSLSMSDETRTRYLEANGYRVLRFWNNEIFENMSGVLSAIDTAMNADRPPTPDPSPPQAGGGE
jgi:very-short-patch-repair endonuclease